MNRCSHTTLALALLLTGVGVRAAEPPQHAKRIETPRIFWTTPVAVRFQLRQLSNAELLRVDRDRKDRKYIPVYEALLIRPGLLSKVRVEAIAALVALKASDPGTVLLAAIQQAAETKNRDGVLYELGHLYVDRGPEQLLAHRDALDALSAESEHPVARRIGYAGLIAAGCRLDALWSQAARQGRLSDVLGSLSLVRSAEQRAAFFPRIQSVLSDGSDARLQAAAIEALGRVPGHEAEVFHMLAAFIGRGKHVGPAVRALSRMDRARWPVDRLPALAASLVRFVEGTSPDERALPHVIDAVQLGHDLAARLPPESGAALRKTLRRLGATVILLRTVRHEMRYDKKYFAVEAGKPVQIILENRDVMPHNVVVVAPGAVEAVGLAAETMQPRPGEEKPFIPSTDKVLFASHLVQPDQRDRVSFAAPEKPGAYGYVCTFPGHWRRMYGVMLVVDDLDVWLAHPTEPADPLGNTRTFVKDWTLDDLSPRLADLGSGRQFDRGKRVFTEAGCIVCHKMRGAGGQVGPELTEVFQRWKGDARNVLREILEPSAVVNEKYQLSMIETAAGEQFVGLVTARDEHTVTLVTNPQNPARFRIDTDQIVDEAKGKDSLMPQGILRTFTAEEILDLLAYLASAGHASHMLGAP